MPRDFRELHPLNPYVILRSRLTVEEMVEKLSTEDHLGDETGFGIGDNHYNDVYSKDHQQKEDGSGW